MRTIKKDELYENLNQFLKTKGIEMTEGSYSKGVHAGCSLLADAINLSQAGLERARDEIERQFDQVRQVIHEKTAPKPPVTKANNPKSKPGTASASKTNGAGAKPKRGDAKASAKGTKSKGSKGRK